MAQALLEHLSGVIGLAGVALYIASYAALQSGVLHAGTYSYPLMNLAAAACVLFSLLTDFNLAAALIQCSWICISLAGTYRIYARKTAIRGLNSGNQAPRV